MRVTVAVVVLVLLAAAPAAGQTPSTPCPQRAGGPAHSAFVTSAPAPRQRRLTTLSLCGHRTGVQVVVRRALHWRDEAGRPRGRILGDPYAAGGRIAWIEAEYTPRGRAGYAATVRVVVRAIGSRRRVRRLVVARRTNADPFSGAFVGRPPMSVVLTPRGDVAWLAGGRVVLLRRGRRAQLLVRGALPPLLLEDGRTLVWSPDDFLGSHDLAPPPVRDGCPRRGAYSPVLERDGILVTEVRYGPSSHLRACVRGSGRDVVVGSARTFGFDGETMEAVTAGSGRVGYALRYGHRYAACETWTVRVVEVATLGAVRSARFACDADDGPVRGTPFVLTSAGSAAWLAPPRTLFSDPRPARVLAVDRANRLTELDRGDLAGLRAEGERVHWANGGEPRSAAP